MGVTRWFSRSSMKTIKSYENTRNVLLVLQSLATQCIECDRACKQREHSDWLSVSQLLTFNVNIFLSLKSIYIGNLNGLCLNILVPNIGKFDVTQKKIVIIYRGVTIPKRRYFVQ